MDEHLLSLLNYEGILGAVATTRDGLVIAAAGLRGEDADVIAAAGSALMNTPDAGDGGGASIEVAGAAVHLLASNEVSLVLLTENDVARDDVIDMMDESLSSVAAALA
jgi:predicted regulator of Ras-like GTPase activity (Roadblock/LC7/MglB family)